MTTIKYYQQLIHSDKKFDQLLKKLYFPDQKSINQQKNRYLELLEKFNKTFPGHDEIEMFSSSGRVEIGGNHTDHNHGKVLTASIDLDSIAVAAKADKEVVIKSEGYAQPFHVNLEKLEYSKDDDGTTALLKGILTGFKEQNYLVGGLNIYITSNVYHASGLSSSASFEMLICSILNFFYNGNKINPIIQAKIGQFAENTYWKKPSGLLDQIACGYGGIITIDFKDTATPDIKKINYNEDFSLVIVNPGEDHADLTPEYAAVANEMTSVATALNKNSCREIQLSDVVSKLDVLRKQLGDRAILRAIHFFEENNRVDLQVKALESNDFVQFCRLIDESGDSSWKLLQNLYSCSTPEKQGIPISLVLSKMFIQKHDNGACRVHGGGFAGVILVILPNELIEGYIEYMKKHLKTDQIAKIKIRDHGAFNIGSLL
ncbi:MAG: galactokinase [Spirochaetes bacterium]|nr:galactokinase [Spirochaetota bacterium]